MFIRKPSFIPGLKIVKPTPFVTDPTREGEKRNTPDETLFFLPQSTKTQNYRQVSTEP